MSNEALGHVWRYAPQRGPSFLVLIAIADIVNDANENEIWFSLANLGKKCRLARSTVAEAIKELENDGWLVRVASKPGQTVRYQFQFVEGEAVWNSRNQSATRTGGVRSADRGSPQGGHNTNININKTNGADDSKESPKMDSNGLQIKELIQMYFDNYTGDLEPSRGQLAGQLQQAIKQIPFDKLQPLVVRVALDGQTISRNTLIYAQNKLQVKPAQPTWTPDKFDPAEFDRPDAVPMPEEVKQLIKQSLAK